MEKIKILFVGANPKNETRLRIDEEARDIEDSIKLSKQRDMFELKVISATTSRHLLQSVLEFEPNILHFSGHGNNDGISLEDINGNSQVVPIDGLVSLFAQFKDTIECVVLNSCYSEAQAVEIQKYINYVVGMNYSIPDKTAIEFSVGFYKALASGKGFEFAFESGLTIIKLSGLKGDSIPILLKKK